MDGEKTEGLTFFNSHWIIMCYVYVCVIDNFNSATLANMCNGSSVFLSMHACVCVSMYVCVVEGTVQV